jgi:hypothetical protein
MFRQARHTVILVVAGLCAAGFAAGAGSAQPVYDEYYDALRNQPSPALRAQATASTAKVVVNGHVVYDSYLDALRIRPQTPGSSRKLAIGARRTATPSVAKPCGRCH